ncbi:MAG TPA: glycosyltransferase [Verrucomicrobiae bacterium]|nr:glycosyltransferase [Verrucomicrobiae bacterium]
MARYLVLGNLTIEQAWDIRMFFSHPEAEFLNTGAGRDILHLQKGPARVMLTDARRGAYDLVFAGNSLFPYFNPRKGLLRNLSNLIWKVSCHPNLLAGRFFPYAKLNSNLVGIDMEDRPVIDNRWFHILQHSVCFFKRELPQNPCNAFLYTTAKTECNGNVLHSKFFRDQLEKLRPISLGIDSDICQHFSTYHAAKKTDVFFSGGLVNRVNRLRGLKQLERLKAVGYAIDIAPERLPREAFLKRCAQAHIVWSPEGYGWDCLRHYEIALVGSVPLIQSPTIHRYAPLMDDVHALYYYVEQDHLAIRVRQALQNRARLIEMGTAARQHVLKWHTLDALSRYIIEETLRTRAETGSAKLK